MSFERRGKSYRHISKLRARAKYLAARRRGSRPRRKPSDDTPHLTRRRRYMLDRMFDRMFGR